MGAQVVGSASISYTAVGSTATTTVNLGTPLHDVRVLAAKERRPVDTLDFTAREVVSYGDGRAEIEGLVRFHNTPQELIDLAENGLDRQVVTYKHGSTHTGIAAWIIEAGDVEPDREPHGPGEFQIRFRMRRNTTGDWSSIL